MIILQEIDALVSQSNYSYEAVMSMEVYKRHFLLNELLKRNERNQRALDKLDNKYKGKNFTSSHSL